jgi:hypothetical protein
MRIDFGWKSMPIMVVIFSLGAIVAVFPQTEIICTSETSSKLPPTINSSIMNEPAHDIVTIIPKTLALGSSSSVKAKSETAWKRIAIISVGSLPFTIFYCDFVFDSVNYVSNGFDSAFAPWPFKSQYSSTVSIGERFTRLGVSAALSLCIGIIGTLIK